eukprot:10656544-Lingulodinium_polyedra.AAC.1
MPTPPPKQPIVKQMTLEEYRQWCQTTAQQQTMTLDEYYQWWRNTCEAAVKKHAEAKHGGSGNVPTKQGEGRNASKPLDSGVWVDFFAQ